jgi:transformer-2 protein
MSYFNTYKEFNFFRMREERSSRRRGYDRYDNRYDRGDRYDRGERYDRYDRDRDYE